MHKGKQVEDPKIMHNGIDYFHIPFHFWPKELQIEHDSIAAMKEQELIDQQMIQEEKERVEKETKDLKRYEEWVDEKIRMDADIELSKLVKIEEQEAPTFYVQA